MLLQYTGAEKGETVSWEILNTWYFEEGEDRDSSPLVLLIEGSEQLSSSVLRDLIYLLSESRESHDLPFSLILHASASKDDLQGLLPAVAAARLSAVAHQLPSSQHLLNCIINEVLVDPQSPIMLSKKTMLSLLRTFEMHEMSISGLKKALHVALLEHFCHNPLSFVLPILDKYEISTVGHENSVPKFISRVCKAMSTAQLDYACTLPSSTAFLQAKSRSLGTERQEKEKFVGEALHGLKASKLKFCVAMRMVQAAILADSHASSSTSATSCSYSSILKGLKASASKVNYLRTLFDRIERMPTESVSDNMIREPV